MQPRKSMEVVQGSTRIKAGHKLRGRKEDLLQVGNRAKGGAIHMHMKRIVVLPAVLMRHHHCWATDNFAKTYCEDCLCRHDRPLITVPYISAGAAAAADGHGQPAGCVCAAGG
jgi:hypothetical protein